MGSQAENAWLPAPAARSYGCRNHPRQGAQHETHPRHPLTHSNYDADDYAYLTAKGWSDDEILARWSEEAAHGNGPCHWESASARAKLAAVTGRQQAMRED